MRFSLAQLPAFLFIWNAALANFAGAAPLLEILESKGIISPSANYSASMSPEPKLFWSRGSRIEFQKPQFSVQLNTLLQTRFEFSDADERTGTKNTTILKVSRARLIFSGDLGEKEFGYQLETDFVANKSADGTKTPSLLNAFIEWHPTSSADIRLGQFKRGLGRQFLTADPKLQFADRSVVSDYFDGDRQQGLLGNMRLDEGRVVLSAGMFNGDSDGEAGRNKPGVDSRVSGLFGVRWNPLAAIDAFEEGDVGHSEDLALSLGAAYLYGKAQKDLGAGSENTSIGVARVDANLKYQGISAHVEAFFENFDRSLADNSSPSGFYAQAGYFLIPKKLEIAGRYAYLSCDEGNAPGLCAGNDSVDEWSGTVDYYWFGHNLKAQTGFALLSKDLVAGDSSDSSRWILQLSGFF